MPQKSKIKKHFFKYLLRYRCSLIQFAINGEPTKVSVGSLGHVNWVSSTQCGGGFLQLLEPALPKSSGGGSGKWEKLEKGNKSAYQAGGRVCVVHY